MNPFDKGVQFWFITVIMPYSKDCIESSSMKGITTPTCLET